MAGGQIKVEVDTRDLAKEIGKYAKRVKGFPVQALGEGLDAAVQDLLESEGRGQWEPLSKATIRRHPKRAGGKLLQDTRQLKSMQHTSGANWAQITSPAKYAGYHVTGTKRMPKRNFLDIDLGSVLEELAQIVANEVVK